MTYLSKLSSLVHWRAYLVQHLTGEILEIGVGKGENLAYYRLATRVRAVEPDWKRAQHAQHTATWAAVPILVDIAPAEELPYADASFDHVVSSLVFCSVTDQRRALAEIRRVLKPGGVLHMVEHVRPDNPQLARLFAMLTPWWRRIAFNCHLDRPTLDVLTQEGWRVTIHGRRWVFFRLSASVAREQFGLPGGDG